MGKDDKPDQSRDFNHGYGSYDYRSYSRMGEALIGGFAGRGPIGYQRSDERILEDVCEVLTRHPDIDASHMEVHVTDGTVTLRGSVPREPMARLAEDETRRISGVREVVNEVTLHPEGFWERIGKDIGFGDPSAAPLEERKPGLNLRERSTVGRR